MTYRHREKSFWRICQDKTHNTNKSCARGCTDSVVKKLSMRQAIDKELAIFFADVKE